MRSNWLLIPLLLVLALTELPAQGEPTPKSPDPREVDRKSQQKRDRRTNRQLSKQLKLEQEEVESARDRLNEQQALNPKGGQAIAAFRDGQEFLLQGKLKRAVKSLEDAVELDPGFLPAQRMLGFTYEQLGQYQDAVRAYVKVIRQDSTFSRLLFYDTGNAYYHLGKPRIALKYFQKFRALQKDTVTVFGLVGEEELARERETVERKLSGRIMAASISTDSTNFINATHIFNLGQPINTAQNDYFPFFANDMMSVLYTRQGGGGDEDLIRGVRRGNEEIFSVSRFGSFNTTQPEGMCTLVRDGETVYFTLCHESTSQGGCDIYSGLLIDGKIGQVVPLPDYVNSSTWDSQAAISCDGQELYFASTRKGGLGGSDIYRSYKEADGTWSEPINLGAQVNTAGDEEAPFLSNDGQTLYYSSTGHDFTYGDQDIYMSRWNAKDKRWTMALNLGPSVNSPHRELGFHLTANGRTGFFASDRPGGQGGLDIYGFRLDDKLISDDITYVSGYVTDSLSGEPIVDQEVPVIGGATYRTNYAGRFFICAPSEALLPLTVDHPEYFPYKRIFAIPQWDNLMPYRIDLFLQTDHIVPEYPPEAPEEEIEEDTVKRKARVIVRSLNVRFGFEDATLTITQIQNIEKFFDAIKDKHLLSIVIKGYTDEIGTDEFNIKLSQDRANAVGRYLTKLGLRADNIRMEGLGELAGSASRELNRKVEVKVRIRELVEVN